MHKLCLIIAMTLLCIYTEGKSVVSVTDQQSFDLLPQKVEELISRGENKIVICLSAGNYVFKDNHINLTGIDNSRLSIIIKGNNAILIPEGKTYSDGEKYEGVLSIYHGWMYGKKDLPIWSNIEQSEGLVEILDYENKLCRIKTPNTIIDSKGDNKHIQITQWYKSKAYNITELKDGYIYFTAPDLANSSYKRSEYNINDDYNYREKYPRYRLCNVNDNNEDVLTSINGKIKLPIGITEARDCKASRFLFLENCKIKQFEMKDLEFWGCSYGYPDSFISIKDTKSCGITIRGCSFYGMHNNVISLVNCGNVTIENNYFQDIYHTGIQSDNRSNNTRVVNNVFFNAGLGLSNSFCVICAGKDYYVSGNVLHNYGYGGIRVGLWYRTPLYNKPCGIVEKNRLLFDKDYMSWISVNGLMDGGAIYISTINDKAIVRYNYIDGFGGAGGNRGVFCDDGALGFEIYGNVIRNIMLNDYCIASRREPSVEKRVDPKSELERSNINNTIRDNILDGKILFKGHESFNNGCQKGANYIMLTQGEEQPQNVIANVDLMSEDKMIDVIAFNGSNYIVLKPDHKKIRRSECWKYLKQYVRKY